MSDFSEYTRLDGLGIAELVRRGKVSASEVLEAALARADACEPRINALSQRFDARAWAATAVVPDGPFRGVPFLLKDLHAGLTGTPTRNGSAFFADYLPEQTELVNRYLAAGLLIFGKTTTPELGLNASTEPRTTGATRNPWNLAKIAGGSSGGAAAAVAAGIVPLAHATDGGGSIRIPASCCGVFGLKPTRVRNPAGPARGEGWRGMSAEHVVSRSVRDSAAALDVSCGPDIGAPYWAVPPHRPYLEELQQPAGRLKIGFTTATFTGAAIDPACAAAVTDAAQLAAGLGHAVEEVAPRFDFDAVRQAFRVVAAATTMALVRKRAAALGRDPSAADFEPVTWAFIGGANSLSAVDYADAVATLHRTGRAIGHFFTEWDVLLTPTMARPPCDLGQLSMMNPSMDNYIANLNGYTPFTMLFNASGNPAMSTPLYWSEGLPIGTQWVGRYGDEASLFRLAAQLEAARPWAARRPPDFPA